MLFVSSGSTPNRRSLPMGRLNDSPAFTSAVKLNCLQVVCARAASEIDNSKRRMRIDWTTSTSRWSLGDLLLGEQMSNWFARWQKRRRELAEGADADFPEANRQRSRFAFGLIGLAITRAAKRQGTYA